MRIQHFHLSRFGCYGSVFRLLSCVVLLVSVCIAAAVFFLPQAACAQNPLSFDAKKASAPSPEALSLPATDDALQKAVDNLETRLRALRSHAGWMGDMSAEKVVPSVASPDEIRKRRQLFSELSVVLDAHAQALRDLKDTRRADRDRAAERRAPEGVSEKPPVSVSVVDSFRDAVAVQKNDIQTLQLRLSIVKGELNKYIKALRESRSQVRQQEELLQKSVGTGKEARQRWLLEMARLRHELNEAAVASFETRRLVLEEMIAARTEALRFFEQKLRSAKQASSLSRSDVDQKLNALDGQRRYLANELAAALKKDAESKKAEQNYREKLDALQIQTGQEPSLSPVQQREARSIQSLLEQQAIIVEAAHERVEVLKAMMQLTDYAETIWEDRLWVTQEQPAGEIRIKSEQMRTVLDNLKLWKSVIQSRILSVAGLAQIHRARLESADKTTPARDSERLVLKIYEERHVLLQRVAEQLAATERLAGHFDNELTERLDRTSMETRLRESFSILAGFLKKLWLTELYVAEETVVVEGAKVVKPVSVTLAKVIQALIILIVGVWIAKKLMRPLRWVVEHKFRQDKSIAAQIGAVAFLLLFMGVVVLSLVSVNIPLAVFAFLGGALAIGIGFGAQNLINNFISGLILLFDRSISVGDIIEVDGQGGKVTAIGMRSSLVRRFDGVEMLVPNSQFLQQKVINWTHSERQMRYAISVGVAYGSPTRKVAELLLKAAEEQDAVLRTPKPSVIFEEFADSALNFSVYFWLELESPRDNRELVSEMRHRIAELFAEAGITIAFPQRDVHIDASAPIAVQVVGQSPTSAIAEKSSSQ